jgi:dinuclear metal center YbgI/SA1388 family protein
VPLLHEVITAAHALWPLSGAEDWDSPGVTTGDNSMSVTRILLAVDAVDATVSEAIECEVGLLVTHHPLLFRGVTTVSEETYKGRLISRLIRANIGLLACHTNADVVENGVSDVLAKLLGLNETRPISMGAEPSVGIGRVGNLESPETLGSLAQRLAKILPATATGIRVSGRYEQVVSRVALCGGAGDSLLSEPDVRGADVYITSDLRHHPAQESREQSLTTSGPALIDVSHWASEWLWLETAAEQLRSQFPEVEVLVSDARTDPWDFVVVQ